MTIHHADADCRTLGDLPARGSVLLIAKGLPGLTISVGLEQQNQDAGITKMKGKLPLRRSPQFRKQDMLSLKRGAQTPYICSMSDEMPVMTLHEHFSSCRTNKSALRPFSVEGKGSEDSVYLRWVKGHANTTFVTSKLLSIIEARGSARELTFHSRPPQKSGRPAPAPT